MLRLGVSDTFARAPQSQTRSQLLTLALAPRLSHDNYSIRMPHVRDPRGRRRCLARDLLCASQISAWLSARMTSVTYHQSVHARHLCMLRREQTRADNIWCSHACSAAGRLAVDACGISIFPVWRPPATGGGGTTMTKRAFMVDAGGQNSQDFCQHPSIVLLPTLSSRRFLFCYPRAARTQQSSDRGVRHPVRWPYVHSTSNHPRPILHSTRTISCHHNGGRHDPHRGARRSAQGVRQPRQARDRGEAQRAGDRVLVYVPSSLLR